MTLKMLLHINNMMLKIQIQTLKFLLILIWKIILLSLPLLNHQLKVLSFKLLVTCNKPHPNLNIYKVNQLESIFVERIDPKKVTLLLVVFKNIRKWMFLILKITITTRFLKQYPRNENRSFLLVTLIQIFWIIMIIS